MLQLIGSQRVGHDLTTEQQYIHKSAQVASATDFYKMPKLSSWIKKQVISNKPLFCPPSSHYSPIPPSIIFLYTPVSFFVGGDRFMCMCSIWLCLCVCVVFGYKHVLWRQAGLPGLKSCCTFYKLYIVGQLTSPRTQLSQLYNGNINRTYLERSQ